MSALAAAAADYLELRRALGFKLVREGRVLTTFVEHLDGRGVETITAEATLAWACQPPEERSPRWSKRLSVARAFAAYMRALDPATEIAPTRLWPTARRQEPFVCNPTEIAALVDAAARVGTPFAAGTYSVVIGLIAVTGMRSGEALRLDIDDVDVDHGLATVRDAKFGKSREVALHASTVAALTAYAVWRDRSAGAPLGPSFFVSSTGSRARAARLSLHWQATIDRAGTERANGRRPRLHDLRHSFAVNTLRSWHDAGLDVEARLPLLSTYLGHANPASTYWYLTATPDLLDAAARRLETQAGAGT